MKFVDLKSATYSAVCSMQVYFLTLWSCIVPSMGRSLWIPLACW